MKTFREDYKTGMLNENRHLETLKSFFNDTTIAKDPNKYAPIDYIGKHYYEMKSRNVKANTYPDTIISKHKIDSYNRMNSTKDFYLIFPFTDCIKYVKYDKEVFETIKCEPFKRHQRSDYNDKEVLYYFIPISILKTIEC